MNGTTETKGLLIITKKTEKKTLIISLKKGFFKSSSGQNKDNSRI